MRKSSFRPGRVCIAEVPAPGLEAQEDPRHQAATDKAPGALLSLLLHVGLGRRGHRVTDSFAVSEQPSGAEGIQHQHGLQSPA